MNYFGNEIRKLRESKGLLLRQVAAFLEIDTAFLSKVERGEKKSTREHVVKLAEFLDIKEEKLVVLWLSDRILDTVDEDPLALEAMQMALEHFNRKK